MNCKLPALIRELKKYSCHDLRVLGAYLRVRSNPLSISLKLLEHGGKGRMPGDDAEGDEDLCPVCLESLIDVEPLRPCGHRIHRQCVQDACNSVAEIRQDNGYPPLRECVCPLCRRVVEGIFPELVDQAHENFDDNNVIHRALRDLDPLLDGWRRFEDITDPEILEILNRPVLRTIINYPEIGLMNGRVNDKIKRILFQNLPNTIQELDERLDTILIEIPSVRQSLRGEFDSENPIHRIVTNIEGIPEGLLDSEENTDIDTTIIRRQPILQGIVDNYEALSEEQVDTIMNILDPLPNTEFELQDRLNLVVERLPRVLYFMESYNEAADDNNPFNRLYDILYIIVNNEFDEGDINDAVRHVLTRHPRMQFIVDHASDLSVRERGDIEEILNDVPRPETDEDLTRLLDIIQTRVQLS